MFPPDVVTSVLSLISVVVTFKIVVVVVVVVKTPGVVALKLFVPSLARSGNANEEERRGGRNKESFIIL